MSTSAAAPRPATRRGAGPEAGRHDTPVPSITDAPESLEADQARRMRRYLIQMGVRAACFVAAYFVTGWLRWTFVVFAVVIPYVAVLLVNAGRDRVTYDTSAVLPQEPPRLTTSSTPDATRIVVDPVIVDPTTVTPSAPGPDGVDPDPQES